MTQALVSMTQTLIDTIVVFVGTVRPLALVWTVADIFNGLMAVPNLIGLLLLSGIAATETRRYFLDRDASR